MNKRCPKIVIVGAGGFGHIVMEAIVNQGKYTPVGFIDDAIPTGRELVGFPVVGDSSWLESRTVGAEYAIVAIGNNRARESFYDRIEASGLRLVGIIDELAVVSRRAKIGSGVFVMAGAVVNSEANVERGSIVNAGATVDHHAVVEAFGHVGAGSVLAGGASMGSRAWLRAGCVLGYAAKVESDQILAPGTVLGG